METPGLETRGLAHIVLFNTSANTYSMIPINAIGASKI